MPYPINDGGSYSIFHTALGLIQRNADVKLLAINTPKNWIPLSTIPSDFMKKTQLEFVKVDTRFNPIKAILNLFSTRSYFVERFYSKDFRLRLIEILKFEYFDIIQLEHVYLCSYLETIRQYSKARIILRPQNVENQIWMNYIKHIKNPAVKIYLSIATKRLIQYENRKVGEVDGVIAISLPDREYFSELVYKIPIVSIPVSFNFSRIESTDLDWKLMGSPPVFYHIGSMDWLPNVQGMQWFITEIIPEILKEFPDFKLKIAGKNMSKWFCKKQDKNIIVDGEVEDALNYQADKQIMIVPLLSGSGIRVKIIEAMALGKVVISTSCGAAGIPFCKNTNILIADTKDEFIRHIRKCLESEDFCKAISFNAQKLAKETFDLEDNSKKIMNYFQYLTGL